ncbi:unnamed protein product, partial [Iphiclides podalirius]
MQCCALGCDWAATPATKVASRCTQRRARTHVHAHTDALDGNRVVRVCTIADADLVRTWDIFAPPLKGFNGSD